MATSKDKWVRRFVITETSRHKRGFTIYKVTSIVFMKTSPERASKVSVWKRYNDFKKLHKSLNNIYKSLNMKETFPPFAKAKFFSRFETEVIKERRASAVKLLEFIAKHQPLFTSNVFVKFFEMSLQSDSGSDCNQSVGSDTSEDSQVGSTIHCGLPENSLLSQSRYENLPQSLSTVLKLPLPLEPDETARTISESSKVSARILEPDSPKLEHLTSRKFDSSNTITKSEDFGQYILVAAAHMSAGYRHESMNEHDEAFIQYKLGITNLSYGVSIDPDPLRQLKIHKKIEKYSERAQTLYNRYLKNNISLLSKPIDELQNYKVIKVMNSVMLAKDLRTNVERVIKTIEKPSSDNVNINNYMTRHNVPFMVKLYGWVETETTIFLILHYIRAQELWTAIKKRYGLRDRLMIKKSRLRSTSCDAAIHPKYTNYSPDQYFDIKNATSKLKITDNDDSMNSVNGTKNLPEVFKANATDNKDLPIRKLLEKAQILLKSVDATIEKSNSIADRLNNPKLISSTTTDTNSISRYYDYNRGSESDLYIVDSSPKSSKKMNPFKNSVRRFHKNSDKRKMNSRITHENSEDSGIEMDHELWKIPENIVKQWTAQIIVALEFLHQQGVVVKNLMPGNLLLDDNDNVVMCYVIPKRTQEFSMQYETPYIAPELYNYMSETTASEAADIWSFGVILYELLTGMNFQTRYAGPFYPHTIISIPSDLSDNAKSLLSSILIFEISERPTIEKIKQHPFYQQIEWEILINT